MVDYLHSIYEPNHTWIVDGIQYSTDDYGFRNDYEYKEVDIVTLGCSDTFGIGSSKDSIWPYFLSQHKNKKVINLGVPGGSIGTCYRVLKGYLSKYKTKQIYLLTPSISRNEFYVNTKNGTPLSIQIGPNFHQVIQDKDISRFAKEVFEKITACSINAKLNQTLYLDAIKYICSSNNIELIETTNPIYSESWNYPAGAFPYAADNLHFGREYQELILKVFLEKE